MGWPSFQCTTLGMVLIKTGCFNIINIMPQCRLQSILEPPSLESGKLSDALPRYLFSVIGSL